MQPALRARSRHASRRITAAIDLGPVILVNECGARPDTVTPNETVSIEYAVENIGDEIGDRTINFTLNDQVVASVDETGMFPNETRTGSVSVVPADQGFGPGIVTVGIEANNLIDCGALTIEEPAEPTNGDTTNGDTTNGDTTNGDTTEPTNGDTEPAPAPQPGGFTREQAILGLVLAAGAAFALARQ